MTLNNESFFLIDVLPNEYYQEKHIKGAINICVHDMTFLENVKKANMKKDDMIVLYGASKNSKDALVASKKLFDTGYENVHIYKGGIKKWETYGYGLELNPKKKVILPKIENKRYYIDKKNSYIEWTGRNFNGKHRGHMELNKGFIKFENGFLKLAGFEINMKKIHNHDIENESYRKMLIKHLQSNDFFHTKKYPTAKIRTKEITSLVIGEYGEVLYDIVGILTIKSITREIRFKILVGPNDTGVFVQGQISFNRVDWGVEYGSMKLFEKLGKHLVNNKISLDLYLRLK